MSEMVERVARALWLAEVEEIAAARDRPFDRAAREAEWELDVKDPESGFYAPIYANMLARARDAIQAMREPTAVMLSRGNATVMDYGPRRSPELGVWRAMIDEALR